jgi:prepilin-type processing-associated H-X9-DG protein
MRRFGAILIFLLAIAGCKPSPASRLLGSWSIIGIAPAAMAFGSDGTYQIQSAGEPQPQIGKYEVKGQQLVMHAPSDNPEASDLTFDMKWPEEGKLDLRPVVEGTAAAAYVDATILDNLTIHLSKTSVVQKLSPQSIPPADDSTTCAANVKQLVLATVMYSQDYDEVYPTDKWQELLTPYVKSTKLFDCPELLKEGKHDGYAFNLDVSGAKAQDFAKPETVPMIFDSVVPGPNALSASSTMPKPSRHPKGNSVGYMDGHAASVP